VNGAENIHGQTLAGGDGLVEAAGFVRRGPLDELDEEALVRILSQPKNALVKQYRSLFQMDGVDLKFTDGAIRAIARQAVDRGTGARGLRSIMERVMLDLMFRIPSEKNVKEVVVNEETISSGEQPLLVMTAEAESA